MEPKITIIENSSRSFEEIRLEEIKNISLAAAAIAVSHATVKQKPNPTRLQSGLQSNHYAGKIVTDISPSAGYL